MPVALQYRNAGGTTTRLSLTLLSGEAFWDSTTQNWFVGDGTTPGGREVANASITTISAATYNVQSTDVGRFFVFTNASGCAVALNQSTTTYFPVQSGAWFFNHSPATVIITATTSLINGASTLTLNPNDSCVIVADGTNYFALVARSGLSGGTPIDITVIGNTTAGTSSSTVSLIGSTLSAAGGVSLGFTGSTLVYSNPNVNATEHDTAIGNTTASTSATTQLIGSSVISGAGDLSVGFSGTTLILSAPSAATSGSTRNIVVLGNTTGVTSSSTVTLTNMSYSGALGASVGFSTTLAGQGVVVISQGAIGGNVTTRNMVAAGGNTTGTTSSQVATLTAKTYSAGGFLSVGFSGGTLVVSGTVGGAASISYWEPRPWITGTTNASMVVGSMVFVPVNNVYAALTFNRIKLINSYNYATLFGPILAIATTTATDTLTASCSLGYTFTAVAYASVNMTQMTSVTTASVSTGFSCSGSVSRSSNSYTESQSFTFFYNVDSNTSQTTTSQSASSTAANNFGLVTNPISTFFTGVYDWVVPLATNMGIGLNAVGLRASTTTGGGFLSTGASYQAIGVLPINPLFYHNVAIGNAVVRTSYGATIGVLAQVPQRPYGAGLLSTTGTIVVGSYNPQSISSFLQAYGAFYMELYTAP